MLKVGHSSKWGRQEQKQVTGDSEEAHRTRWYRGHLVPFLWTLTSRSGEASAACFLRLASLDSFSVSRTSCLMKPPGMTEKRGGGEDGGGLLSSSRICFAEARKEKAQ